MKADPSVSRPDASVWQGVSQSVEHTVRIGQAVGRLCRAGDVIALVGELGAGKTRFVAGMACGLGLDPAAVASPTFVFMHEYEPAADRPDSLTLVHIDAYRIAAAGDPASIGWESGGGELADRAVIAMEWADRLGEEMGANVLRVTLEHAGEQQRRVTIQTVGNWDARREQLQRSLNETDE